MRKYTFNNLVLLLVVSIVLLSAINCLAGSNDIKSRMDSRLPIIVELQKKGIIGENNKGFLGFVPNAIKEKEAVIVAENNDRCKIYIAIAKREGISVQEVGKLRAKSLAQKAKPGEWLQNPSGKWYKK